MGFDFWVLLGAGRGRECGIRARPRTVGKLVWIWLARGAFARGATPGVVKVSSAREGRGIVSELRAGGEVGFPEAGTEVLEVCAFCGS